MSWVSQDFIQLKWCKYNDKICGFTIKFVKFLITRSQEDDKSSSAFSCLQCNGKCYPKQSDVKCDGKYKHKLFF